MNREMAFRQQYKYGSSLWFKLLGLYGHTVAPHTPLLPPFGLAAIPHCSESKSTPQVSTATCLPKVEYSIFRFPLPRNKMFENFIR